MQGSRCPGASGENRAGFSLVEVLVSFALLGLAAAAVLSLLLRSGLNNLDAARADALTAMARSSLLDVDAPVSSAAFRGAENSESVWCQSVSAWQDDCGAEAPQFRRIVRSEPMLVPARPGESVPVTAVTLEVTALQSGRAVGERSIRLVTFRSQ